MEGQSLAHRPALDVVRGAAVALVLVGHLGLGYAAPVGVTVFFVLSGYLITRLLRDELVATGRVLLPIFFRRRMARLLPAVLVMATVVAIAGMVAGDPQLTLYAVASTTYLANWLMTAGWQMGPLRHIWSLAVEEQFYLVWPLIFLLVVARLRRPGLVLAILVAVALTWGGVAFSGPTEFRTDIRVGALFLGCALVYAGGAPRWAMLIAIVPLVALSVAVWPDALAGWGYGASALAAGIVVAWAGASAWAGWSPGAYLGRISYGVYLWHLPLYALLTPGPIAVLATLAIAVASFHLLEQPLRQRLSGAVAPHRGGEVVLGDERPPLPDELEPWLVVDDPPRVDVVVSP